ncbi:MAG: nucleotidyltransferase domain-containing protein [Candidatus Latescibacteria bacterium]|nr:nucleotidyltransferase domain-containing protein [Candidatus Latescibacterota bacterium]
MKSLVREIPLSIKKLADEIKEAVGRTTPGAHVILYGSRARDEARTDSDFDLLILLPESVAPGIEEALDQALYDLELKWGVVLSTMIYAQKVWDYPLYRAMPLHQAVDREGILL